MVINMNENKYTKQDILRMVEEEDVEFIRLQFVDIFGTLKNIAITSSQLEKVLSNDKSFCSSSIDGFMNLHENDLYLHPDLDTFAIFPWRPQQGKVARLICDLYTPEGVPFCADTRQILKRVVDEAKKLGMNFYVGTECEFFLFHIDDEANPTTITHEKAGYFDVAPLDFAENVRRDIVLSLEDMGFEVEASHHEIAPGQHEIDFKYSDAVTAADNLLTFKMTVKSIAKRHGLHATFMPKPKSEVDGAGMHIWMSVEDENGKNLFYDAEDDAKLSETAYYFIAGLLKHIRALTAITNPLVNSYKRLMPGFGAPAYATWSHKFAYPLIWVPSCRRGNMKIELRLPDSTTNPYLALALCLAAGLDGIQNKLQVPESAKEDIAGLTVEECAKRGFERLPEDLAEAVNALEKDEFMVNIIGKEVAEKYIQQKRREWNVYRSQVTQWEIDEYLNRY